MKRIGVRELRQNASAWLARVVEGESFVVTDRGRPVATLGPAPTSAWQRLVDAGAVSTARGDLRDLPAPTGGASTAVSDALAADRDDDR